MIVRTFAFVAILAGALSLPSCSGGARGQAGASAGQCSEPAAFCLLSCNVGCSTTGCSVREIAQNHQLRFQFSQDVDPGTVDFTTISLKTPTGEAPTGEFVVEGATITFLPEVRTIGSASFFGFAPNQEYILSLPGAEETVALKSTSGDRLLETFTCTMQASLGIVDIDGQPPSAQVIAPRSSDVEVPRDTQFIVRTSEPVDPVPFLNAPTGPSAPIQFYLVARQGAGGPCDITNRERTPLVGTAGPLESDVVAGVSTFTFTPSEPLPGNFCVEVRVTPGLRDIAGNPAVPRSFYFRPDSSQIVFGAIEETFDDADQFDADGSAGTWRDGSARFLDLGGDGRHGAFEPTMGALDASTGEWVFDTAAPWIGGVDALVSQDLPNGNYFFSTFIVPQGVRVRFTGTFPARIHVRGRCQIEGEVAFGGRDQPRFVNPFNLTGDRPGQAGALAGPGGGAGGRGGQQCSGLGSEPIHDGADGEDLRVAATHAFAGEAVGSGGSGSPVIPADGLIGSAPRNVFFGNATGVATNGGGGGGGVTAGGDGHVPVLGRPHGDNTPIPEPAGPTPGGRSISLEPVPSGDSIDHFLVSGGGGGGGGSHPYFSTRFFAGCGGGGGGGAVAIRVGRQFAITNGGSLSNRGGSGVVDEMTSGLGQQLAAPGGGGAGGAILVQVGRDEGLRLDGSVDVRGGVGGGYLLSTPFAVGEVRAGDGGDGLFRIETPTLLDPSTWLLNAQPAPGPLTVGVRSDTDSRVAIASRAYETGQSTAPVWERYEIDAVVDGLNVTFSDDPALGVPALPGAPIEFFVQGLRVDPASGEVSGGHTEWFRRVRATAGELSLNSQARAAFRWVVVHDRSVASTVQLTAVRIVYSF